MFFISENYQQVIDAVIAGILRFLDRPGNEYMYLNFAAATAAEIYERGIPLALFEQMGAAAWLVQSGFGQELGAAQAVDVWDEAVYQVIALLSVPEVSND